MQVKDAVAKTNTICRFCHRVMEYGGKGCTARVRYVHKRSCQRIKFGFESNWTAEDSILYQYCGDCGCALGKLHHLGCDMEECSFCHKQAITCDAEDLER